MKVMDIGVFHYSLRVHVIMFRVQTVDTSIVGRGQQLEDRAEFG